LVIGLVYAGLRSVTHYRRRHLYIDAQSRLPNFTAYRRDLEAGLLERGVSLELLRHLGALVVATGVGVSHLVGRWGADLPADREE
jgi:hypothetical protein